MMKKAYIQPVCEEINVHLIGSVLDQGVIGNWSEVAAGDDPGTGGIGWGDANAYTFEDEEDNNEINTNQRITNYNNLLKNSIYS